MSEEVTNEELPKGWATTSLESITSDVSYGYTAKSNRVSGEAKMLRITDIQDNKVDWEAVPFCSISPTDKSRYLLKRGDLVFARTGATVGKSFLIEEETKDAVFASYLIRVRCLDHQLAKYLSFFFNSPAYWDQITEFSAGIGQPNVNGTKLKALSIPLAPLAEQKRIADKLELLLGQVDACRAHLYRLPALLKRFRQSVLAAATSGKLTEKWREENGVSEEREDSTLGTCGLVSGGLTKNAARRTSPMVKLYLRVANVQTNSLDLSDVSEIGLTESEYQKTRLAPGDLLIVEGNGSIEQLGRVAMWGGELDDCVHQNHLIRWRGAGPSAHFVLYWLLSPRGREELMSQASTTTGLHTLSISKISKIPIELPTFSEQQEIVRRVEDLFAFADRIESRLAEARKTVERLTPATLAKAFRGELVPQDPNDEPASALLERSQANSVNHPKSKRKSIRR